MLAALSDWVPVIVTVLGGGGIVGAIVAFLKIRPEAGQIAVVASQGALIVQTGVIETLREENSQLRDRMEELESKVAVMSDLRERVAQLERERRNLKDENTRLTNRVKSLEKRLKELGHEVNGT